MGEVKRYDATASSVLWQARDGDYVTYDDYAALQARLAEVEAALKLHQDLDAINVAEVARLTAQLATARRDALEDPTTN